MSFFSNKFVQRAAAAVTTVASVVTFGLAALPSNAFGGERKIEGRVGGDGRGGIIVDQRVMDSDGTYYRRDTTRLKPIGGGDVYKKKRFVEDRYDPETGSVSVEWGKQRTIIPSPVPQQGTPRIVRPHSAGPSGLCSPGYYGVELFDGYGAVVDTVCCPNGAGLVSGQRGYECHVPR